MDRLVLHLLTAISLAMGACLIAPSQASRLFGLGPRLITIIAARDLAIGLGLSGVLPGSRRLWLLLHATADLIDGAFVAHSLRHRTIARTRGLAWLALAAGGALTALRLALHRDP
jgi:hypothetical protein